MTRVEQPPKLAGATQTYQWDFASLLAAGETISSAAATASVYSGTDATPSTILSGSPSSSGTVVSQNLTGGTLGVIYQVLVQIVTSASQTLQLSSLVAIVPPSV